MLQKNIDQKHEDIQKRIDIYKINKDTGKSIPKSNSVFNITIELVAGVIVGLMIGLLFDNLFDSKPLFLIICLIISIISVFKLIWNKYIKTNGT